MRLFTLKMSARLTSRFAWALLSVVHLTANAQTNASQEGQPVPLKMESQTNRAVSPPANLFCPQGSASLIKVDQQRTRQHHIVLAWSASPKSLNPDYNTVGYCLYRSKKPNAAKQNPTCGDCEQINTKPFGGTSCIDDSLDDNTVYYYIVIAMDTKGRISPASNEANASITPPSGISTASASGASQPPPRCNGGAAVR